MQDNKQIIEQFYKAFQQKDAAGMNVCYSGDIIFSNPVFMLLKEDEVKYMWEMFCKNTKNFSLTFGDIVLLDEEYATCKWQANYIFNETGKKITHNAKAYMRIKNGKIIEHSDAFRLSKWIGQTLGLKGILFGWTGFLKKSVQNNARKSLLKYMEDRG